MQNADVQVVQVAQAASHMQRRIAIAIRQVWVSSIFQQSLGLVNFDTSTTPTHTSHTTHTFTHANTQTLTPDTPFELEQFSQDGNSSIGRATQSR